MSKQTYSTAREVSGGRYKCRVNNFLTNLITKNETGSKIIIMQMGWLLSLVVFKNASELKNQKSTISYFGLSTVVFFQSTC